MLDKEINIMVDRTICYRMLEGKQRIYQISINGNFIHHEFSLKEMTILHSLITQLLQDEEREMSHPYKRVLESE